MGLDVIELVMEFEDSFGIKIEDEKASTLLTPGEVIDYIWSQVGSRHVEYCHSQRGFYLLRNACVTVLGKARKDVVLQTKIRDLVDVDQERVAWPEIGRAVRARTWPKLSRSVWLTRTIVLGILLVFAMGLAVSFLLNLGPQMTFTMSIAMIALFVWLAMWMTDSYRLYIPSRYVTIRDMVPLTEVSDRISWTRDQVASRVKEIVMFQLGLKESQYREDADFVEELGMD